MRWERGLILAGAVGTMQRQLEACVAYARERDQFGQPIGEFQAVSNKIADMRLRLEAARLLLYQAAWLGQQGSPTWRGGGDQAVHLARRWSPRASTRSRSTAATDT